MGQEYLSSGVRVHVVRRMSVSTGADARYGRIYVCVGDQLTRMKSERYD